MTSIGGPNEGVDILKKICARVLAEHGNSLVNKEPGQQKEKGRPSRHLVMECLQNSGCPSEMSDIKSEVRIY